MRLQDLQDAPQAHAFWARITDMGRVSIAQRRVSIEQRGGEGVDRVHISWKLGLKQAFMVHLPYHAAVYGTGLFFILKTPAVDVFAVPT